MTDLPDQVLLTNRPDEKPSFRRIVGQLGDYVYYSTGDDMTHACLWAKLTSWAIYHNAYTPVDCR